MSGAVGAAHQFKPLDRIAPLAPARTRTLHRTLPRTPVDFHAIDPHRWSHPGEAKHANAKP